MSSDLPPEWEAALVNAGVVDQRGRVDRASRRELARRVTVELGRTDPVNASTITAMINGTRRTEPAIVAAVAKVLGTNEVFDWVGQPRRVSPSFVIPEEINLLTPRQQDAIRQLIRAMAEERDDHGREPATTRSPAGVSPAGDVQVPPDSGAVTELEQRRLERVADQIAAGEIPAAARDDQGEPRR